MTANKWTAFMNGDGDWWVTIGRDRDHKYVLILNAPDGLTRRYGYGETLEDALNVLGVTRTSDTFLTHDGYILYVRRTKSTRRSMNKTRDLKPLGVNEDDIARYAPYLGQKSVHQSVFERGMELASIECPATTIYPLPENPQSVEGSGTECNGV